MQRAMLRALGRAGPRLPQAVRVQPARGRKSRHDPPAKSKLGRTATPPAVDPAELFVLSERYARYRQTVGALRRQFAREVRERLLEARVGSQAARKAEQDAAEHRELLAWNQAENRRLHELRVARRLQEARDGERRRAELEARRAEEARAWARLKEEEVLRLQVGRGAPGRAAEPLHRSGRWARPGALQAPWHDLGRTPHPAGAGPRRAAPRLASPRNRWPRGDSWGQGLRPE